MTSLDVVTCCAPLDGPALSDAEADSTATLFKALADPARVKIVNLLARAEQPVCACESSPCSSSPSPP
jgi:ArsR family transcriptional regulator